jgi:hypothetical protein
VSADGTRPSSRAAAAKLPVLAMVSIIARASGVNAWVERVTDSSYLNR